MDHKVILDTNIFHNTRTDTSGIQVLLRLVKSGILKLVIPEVVAREYLTKRVEESEVSKKNTLSALRKLKNSKVYGSEYSLAGLESSISSAIKKIEPDFYGWASQEGIETYKINNSSIEEIFDDYFLGEGAFKKPKSRDDFPDAVIFDCIKKVSLESIVTVITKDQHLIECCNSLDSVRTYSSLDSLFEEQDIKKAIIDLDSLDGRINGILKTLGSSSVSVLVEDFIRDFKKEEYLEKQFYYDSIRLPTDLDVCFSDLRNDSVQAVFSGEPDLYSLFVSKAKYLGENKFSLSINMECLFELHIFCSPETYEKLAYPYRKELFCDEELIAGEEHIYGKLKGYLESNIVIDGIDLNINPQALEVHLGYLGQDRCMLEPEIENATIDIIDL
ncbi:PIN domain-containing protein [Marinomonas sp. TW1]|uniref:PIN domain-containing protein n=1 Tax=Marinomonas sp. TW1 TaxID=1561203 RepID=UPI0007AFD72F|nr:PIN domain-containing protein [Marinomonas sp. TW1]KZN13842.1 hypothetical protein OA79_08970 [Marinomonas sp. TW1]